MLGALAGTAAALAFNLAVIIGVAPLAEGVVRKLTARLQSRQGPPLWQPYWDLLKLLGKENLESSAAPVFQRAAASLACAAALFTALLLPMGFGPPLAQLADVILLVYVLTLSSVALLFAGLASGSPYSLLGVCREMMTVLLVEPLLAIALIAASVQCGSMRLDSIFRGGVYASQDLPISGVLFAVILLLALQAFVKRLPFDQAEAETELMDGTLMEYSGPRLALLKHAQMTRLIAYCVLFAALCIPWGNDWPFPIGFLWFWCKAGTVLVVVTLVAATHARYRMDQVLPRFAVLSLLALGALFLATLGY
jgi:formate hydrogenlyase subunit 4